MSQDSWEYSTWAQPEPSLPETEIRRLSLVVHPPEAFMCGAGDFHLDGSKPLPLYSDGAFDLDELVFAPELMMAGAGLDPNNSDVTLEPMMSAAHLPSPSHPLTRTADSSKDHAAAGLATAMSGCVPHTRTRTLNSRLPPHVPPAQVSPHMNVCVSRVCPGASMGPRVGWRTAMPPQASWEWAR